MSPVGTSGRACQHRRNKVMMTADEERWAEALQILRWKGADAGAYVAERIAALALARGEAGVVRFNAIAARLDRLLAGTVQ